MRLIKKINNNFALARDSTGETIIVEGRGIGFQRMPCDLDDLSQITRTYYDVKEQDISLLQNVQEDVLQVSSEVFDFAAQKIASKLNPNLALILADHIQFCIDRLEQRINVKMPIYYDVEHLYPVESEIARFAMKLIRTELNVSLPVAEKTGIALNIINSEINQNSGFAKTEEVIELCASIIETTMGMKIDRTSFSFARFVTHLEYLLSRKTNETDVISQDNLELFSSLSKSLDESSPELNSCLDILELELGKRNYPLNEEEKMYLKMHLLRICNRSNA